MKRRDSDRARVNADIRVPEVRLIDQEGNQVGVVSSREAMRLAEEAGNDLVEINPNSKPPVCKIMDYGKFLFEEKKKQSAAKKKQKVYSVREIRFRLTTEEGDYQVKLRNLIRFLESGDRAKVTIRFRGREITHPELGMRLLGRLKEDLKPYGKVEQEPKREGRQLVMLLAPIK